jgi:hypothetical protein
MFNGSDNLVTNSIAVINGGGCFGNNNQGDFTSKFIKCTNNGNITGNYNAGICVGGFNALLNSTLNAVIISCTINGGGCFGNNNKDIFKSSFIKCKNNGNMNGNHNGGICTGDNNNIINTFNGESDNMINGGGCFGNNNQGTFKSVIYKCEHRGNIDGNFSCGLFNNNGNICINDQSNVTSNNFINGGGCFGNYNTGILYCDIIKCSCIALMNGNYNSGICNGGSNLLADNTTIKGGGCFGNYNERNINVQVESCNINVIITGNNCSSMFVGTIANHSNNIFGTEHFCACNYNLGVIKAAVNNCAIKYQLNGSYNGGIFNDAVVSNNGNNCSMIIDSCNISGSIINTNTVVASCGGIFNSDVLCSNNANSINKINILNCIFNIYAEGNYIGVLAGIRVNSYNTLLSVNKFNVTNSKFKIISNNNTGIGLFGGVICISSDNNSQININQVDIHRHNVLSYIIMPYNDFYINVYNNINLRCINIYDSKYLLLQPNYLFSQKHIKYYRSCK